MRWLGYAWTVAVNCFYLLVIGWVFDKLDGRRDLLVIVAILGLIYVAIRSISMYQFAAMFETLATTKKQLLQLQKFVRDPTYEENHYADNANADNIEVFVLTERKPDKKDVMTFPVGVGVDGDTIVSDLSDSNTCHILVAGTSGSGKSEWLKTLVASLALRHPSEHIRFALMDPKILTFGGIKDSPYLWKPIATDIESALAILDAAAAEMDSRYHVLARHGHVSLSERFRAGMIDLPYVVLVFDEFADLILTGRHEKKEFEETVARIAGKGRAAGIHLVLATQRPDRTVVTGLIKSNLPMKVCLRVTNATNSLIVLGEAGAESLLGKSDLLCDLGKGIVRAQSYFIPQTEFLAALNA